MGSEQPDTINGLRIPDQDDVLHGVSLGTLARKLGIRFVECAPERAVGVMPVDGNEQPFGLLHGGASAALGETLGSFAANFHAGPDRFAVGVDLTATHTGAIADGWVTGVCTAIHLGGSMTVHEIVVSDEHGRRISTVRITNYLRDRR